MRIAHDRLRTTISGLVSRDLTARMIAERLFIKFNAEARIGFSARNDTIVSRYQVSNEVTPSFSLEPTALVNVRGQKLLNLDDVNSVINAQVFRYRSSAAGTVFRRDYDWPQPNRKIAGTFLNEANGWGRCHVDCGISNREIGRPICWPIGNSKTMFDDGCRPNNLKLCPNQMLHHRTNIHCP